MTGINQGSGVDYDKLDPFKRLAQEYASQTDGNIDGLFPDTYPFLPSRGESAFLMRNGDHYLGYVLEGLGTKNRVADAMQIEAPTPGSRYEAIGHDGVATMVNDLITLGVLPTVVGMYAAVGDGAWFKDEERAEALVRGWALACGSAGARCVWGPGETPALGSIIYPDALDLAGFASGRTVDLNPWGPHRLAPGDAIIFCESTGLHMNGFSAVRREVDKLPLKYRTRIPGAKRRLGKALLEKAHIYAPAVRLAIGYDIDVHYAAHVTGHGWRKIMRAPQPLSYVIDTLPTERAIFRFLKILLGYDDLTMYTSYNMGVGFVFFVNPAHADRFLAQAELEKFPFRMFRAGQVERGPKQVVIEPLEFALAGDSLNIR